MYENYDYFYIRIYEGNENIKLCKKEAALYLITYNNKGFIPQIKAMR